MSPSSQQSNAAAVGSAFHPQQSLDQLQLHLVERLHSSDAEAAWNDHLGRVAAGAGRKETGSFAACAEAEAGRLSPAPSRRKFLLRLLGSLPCPSHAIGDTVTDRSASAPLSPSSTQAPGCLGLLFGRQSSGRERQPCLSYHVPHNLAVLAAGSCLGGSRTPPPRARPAMAGI
jgi:hypothetical protein